MARRRGTNASPVPAAPSLPRLPVTRRGATLPAPAPVPAPESRSQSFAGVSAPHATAAAAARTTAAATSPGTLHRHRRGGSARTHHACRHMRACPGCAPRAVADGAMGGPSCQEAILPRAAISLLQNDATTAARISILTLFCRHLRASRHTLQQQHPQPSPAHQGDGGGVPPPSCPPCFGHFLSAAAPSLRPPCTHARSPPHLSSRLCACHAGELRLKKPMAKAIT